MGVVIDGYLIARVLAGCFAGEGDVLARQVLQGVKFRTAAVMPMFRGLPPEEQVRFAEHERLQAVHMSQFPALPAVMVLEQQYKRMDEVGFYTKSVKYHVRSQSFNWLLAALCDVGAERNFVIGWNAGEWWNLSQDDEFRAQSQFLKDHLANFC